MLQTLQTIWTAVMNRSESILLQDKARPLTFWFTRLKIMQLDIEVLPHLTQWIITIHPFPSWVHIRTTSHISSDSLPISCDLSFFYIVMKYIYYNIDSIVAILIFFTLNNYIVLEPIYDILKSEVLNCYLIYSNLIPWVRVIWRQRL